MRTKSCLMVQGKDRGAEQSAFSGALCAHWEQALPLS